MRVSTLGFGVVDVPETCLLHFPDGIHGFPHMRRCCLLPHPDSPGVRWLQCIDDPALVFLTVEPYLAFTDYQIELSAADADALGLTDARDAAVLALVTASNRGATANLLAPIIINTQTRSARQVILEASGYHTKHPIVIGGPNGPPADAK
jgi:flagellar assembly factor FliW